MEITRVLLTGGTGFLGTNLIHELVFDGIDVICLVRGENTEAVQERIRLSLGKFFPHQMDEMMEKITVVKGDFTQEWLGMTPALYDEIGHSIDAVIHTGAFVKHFGKKNDFTTVNVSGTERVAKFCCKYHKFLLFSSSVAVFKQNIHGANLYAHSKLMAEEIINKYVEHGLKRCIVRIGALTGRSDNGFFQENTEENALYARLQFIIKGRLIPKQILEDRISMTPVDLCCRAMRILLENQTEGIGSLSNDKVITYRGFVQIVEKLGYRIQIQDIPDYHEIYRYGTSIGMNREAVVGFYLYYRGYHQKQQRSMDQDNGEQGNPLRDVLEQEGFQWIRPDETYISRIISWNKRQKGNHGNG